MTASTLSRARLLAPLGILAVTALALLRNGTAPAAEAPRPARPAVDFNRQVLPLLSENCFACHGPDEKQRKARLRLDTREGAFGKLRGGGFAVVPGKPAESELVARITSEEPTEVMPPPKTGKKLTPEQVTLLRRWIDQGAPWSSHWAFTAPRRPPVPRVIGAGWPRNPIDFFILARLEREGLSPSPEADRIKLLRRVTLDLTGLPPTPAEVDAFLADQSPEAYERVVDRLLQSPHYGEHMARFWLDAARYCDTHGLHLDNYREMWPYRDWVIKAFNSNLPYDRFVVEQLAGDLLPGAALDQVVASGFNRCHVTTSEGGSIAEEVYVRNVVDRVDTTGTVFLGLTIACCRCHDHKYDPVRQKEYYQLFAFFNSLDDNPLDGNVARHAPVVRVGPAGQTAALTRLEQKVASLRRKIAAEVAKVKYDETADAREPRRPAGVALGAAGILVRPKQGKKQAGTFSAWLRAQKAAGGAGLPRDVQRLVRLAPSERSKAQRQQLRDYFIEHAYPPAQPIFEPLHRQLAKAEKERDRLDKLIPATLVSKERGEPRPAYVLKRGEYDQRGEPVGRDTPAFLPPLPKGAPRNRLGFARWVVSPGNPLTARVAVNRLWQQCFGTGLVKTAEDFGS
jgi:hypothetical protein